ncbi:ste12-like transcription factor [Paraphaeosphaeria minitans]|uniref:Ste12-like transcription factor n=1 Tax=Paraphaeosphaeria minitans TaxID=565426 RepID=A0A9P6GKY7_9PLEO|nr:ste12-like transcription factor [Paraphaeosphaeria minitans]
MSAAQSRFVRMSALADTGTKKDSAMDIWELDDDNDLDDSPTDLESYGAKLSNLPANFENDDNELSDMPTDLESDDGKINNLPTDLDSDDGKPKTTKRTHRVRNFQTKQVYIDADFGEENEEGDQSDVHEESGDEWNPSVGGANSTCKATRKYTKKNASKTKKTAKTAPLACNWPGCDAHLTRMDHLRRHIATHTDGKPFRCPTAFCGYGAKRRDNLAAHLKLQHNFSAAAAREIAAIAAEAASDEIRSLARAVEATIKAAASDSDTELDQDVAVGSKRKNKDRGQSATHSKKRARV